MFTSKPQKAGVIGLGIIGNRIAGILRDAGLHVYVWSRTPKPEPNFMSSPAGVAEVSDYVQIFVRNGDDLIGVIDQMKPALTKDHIVINNSTVSPEATRSAAGKVEGAGASFLDCPFTGSKLAAEAGQLVYYVSGQSSVLKRARSLLDLSSKEVLYLGDHFGDATVLKIATNMISAATVQVLAESLALARSQGIDPEKLGEALKLNACNSPLVQMKLPTMKAGDYEPHFSLKNMFKDAQFALNLANDAGIDLPALSTTASVMFNTIRKGRAEEDYSVLFANYEKTADAAPQGQSADADEEPARE